ncbi:MAG: hypothetical protein IPP83_08685 [Flavobacteriales bacterium]|nr:hypothetical protein [Flavobacteriales bacterium]
MANGKEKIIIREKLSVEGEAMDTTFKKATAKAARRAFAVRKTIMIEKDGWLVMVNKAGKVIKRVKRLDAVKVPAA